MDALLEEMDGASFAEWIAFDNLEPLDPAGMLLAGLRAPSPGEAPAAQKPNQTWEAQFKLLSKYAVKKHGK